MLLRAHSPHRHVLHRHILHGEMPPLVVSIQVWYILYAFNMPYGQLNIFSIFHLYILDAFYMPYDQLKNLLKVTFKYY